MRESASCQQQFSKTEKPGNCFSLFDKDGYYYNSKDYDDDDDDDEGGIPKWSIEKAITIKVEYGKGRDSKGGSMEKAVTARGGGVWKSP